MPSRPWDCPDCGQVHPKGCTGHTLRCPSCGNGVSQDDRRQGLRECRECSLEVVKTPCKAPPTIGNEVCASHGGKMASKVRQRARVINIGPAGLLLSECQVDGLHPLTGLLEVVERTGTMMRALGELVAELDIHPIIGEHSVEHLSAKGDVVDVLERIITNHPLYGPDDKGNGRADVLLVLYGEWSDRHARACKLALDAGVDERRLRIAESQVEQLRTALMRAFATAGLSAIQQDAVKVALAGELRSLEPKREPEFRPPTEDDLERFEPQYRASRKAAG